MTTVNGELGKIGNNQTANWKDHIGIKEADRIAAELVNEYRNPDFRKWYCKLVYELGPHRIEELRGRVRDAKDPAKLFSKLASEELRAKQTRERLHG